jgi:hypothetical protein
MSGVLVQVCSRLFENRLEKRRSVRVTERVVGIQHESADSCSCSLLWPYSWAERFIRLAGASKRSHGYGQASKGMRWMPWRRETMKDVDSCDKPRGAANRH